MTRTAPADLQRWSEELARDPASTAFVPLANAYRRSGHLDAALRLCLRGLERHPYLVEGHTLLARLYLEAGDRERACDEWAMALRLEPTNFEALRGLGFFALDQGDYSAARRQLRAAAAIRPDDVAVREALALATARIREAEEAPSAEQVRAQAGAAERPRDPMRIFEPLEREALFQWAAVVDRQGLVLAASSVEQASAEVEARGAAVGAVAEEADRTSDQLGLGAWRGMLLEGQDSVLHLSAIGDGLVVMLAARPDAPAGWVMRSASRAATLARDFFGAGS